MSQIVFVVVVKFKLALESLKAGTDFEDDKIDLGTRCEILPPPPHFAKSIYKISNDFMVCLSIVLSNIFIAPSWL